MTLDELAAGVERRQCASGCLRKLTGQHVTPMTHAQAQRDYMQGMTGYGCDYDGIKQSPDSYDSPAAKKWREDNREHKTAYMREWRERRRACGSDTKHQAGVLH